MNIVSRNDVDKPSQFVLDKASESGTSLSRTKHVSEVTQKLLSTIQQPTTSKPITNQTGLGQAPKPLSRTRKRPTIRVKLSPKDIAAAPIVEAWKKKRVATTNVASAIQLYDALLSGDADKVRQFLPKNGDKILRQADPLLDSNNINTDQNLRKGEEEKLSELGQVLADVTCSDPILLHNELEGLASKLVKAGYMPGQVRDWYNRYWRVTDWRGKKGEYPELKDVKKLIYHVKNLPPLTASPTQLAAENNPYLQDEYFRRRVIDLVPDSVIGIPQTRRIDSNHQSAWDVMISQFTIQLNKSTFDMWLRHARLLEAHDMRWSVWVPHINTKDWLERNLIDSMRKIISRYLLKTPIDQPSDPQITIEFEVQHAAS